MIERGSLGRKLIKRPMETPGLESNPSMQYSHPNMQYPNPSMQQPYPDNSFQNTNQPYNSGNVAHLSRVHCNICFSTTNFYGSIIRCLIYSIPRLHDLHESQRL